MRVCVRRQAVRSRRTKLLCVRDVGVNERRTRAFKRDALKLPHLSCFKWFTNERHEGFVRGFYPEWSFVCLCAAYRRSWKLCLCHQRSLQRHTPEVLGWWTEEEVNEDDKCCLQSSLCCLQEPERSGRKDSLNWRNSVNAEGWTQSWSWVFKLREAKCKLKIKREPLLKSVAKK